MEANTIYVKTSSSKSEKRLSYSIDELEILIDDLNLLMPDLCSEEIDCHPLLKTIGFLTELKKLSKKTD